MQKRITRWLKDKLIRTVCAGLRIYFQHGPGFKTKLLIWDRFIVPYIFWRPIEIEARAAFGARFEGSLDDSIHRHMYFFGVWEPAITAQSGSQRSLPTTGRSSARETWS